MAHYPAFPGPGTAPSSTAPTAAEKAALDGANPPLSGTNVVVGASQLGPQLTADQKAALDGASPALSGTNVVVGASQLGYQLNTNEALAITNANDPPIGASNPLASVGQLVRVATGTGGVGATKADFAGMPSYVAGPDYRGLLLVFPATGQSKWHASDPIVAGSAHWELGAPLAGGEDLVALVFWAPTGLGNVSTSS